jgi:hypothetical protein
MNDWDKNNFTYMQSLDTEQFDAWALTLSDDDIEYAAGLYRQARVELAVATIEKFDDVEDLGDAQSVLRRIAINVKHRVRPDPF